MATATELLICGCPVAEEEDNGHQPGCWMGEAEGIAEEAITANNLRTEPGNATVAVVQALAEAGYLSGVPAGQDLFGLLDYLAEAHLLVAPSDGA
jgi:hypothetical protein